MQPPQQVMPLNPGLSQQVSQPGQNDDNDIMMDEELSCNQIPITNFKSNNIQKKEKFI